MSELVERLAQVGLSAVLIALFLPYALSPPASATPFYVTMAALACVLSTVIAFRSIKAMRELLGL